MKNKVHALPYRIDLIKYIAELIVHRKNGRDLSNVLIVFPGRRPALYLKKHLLELLGSAFLPPQVLSMDDFVYFLFNIIHPDFKYCNPLNVAWYLYNSNQTGEINLTESKNMTFSHFIPFGLALTKSIDELDMELISEEKIKNLKYINAESTEQRYDSLGIIRKKMHEYFRTNRLFSRGFAYLETATEIANINLANVEQIYLCGLFALTNSEVAIVKYLMENRSAEFYTQLEEIPSIFRNLLEKLNAQIVYPEKAGEISSSIRYYSAPNLHMEVQSAGSCLLRNCQEPSSTAIVLPDDSPLIPLLNNIMQKTDFDYNVTMGFPISRTPHFNLIENLIKAQQNKTNVGYYVVDYLNVILHPYIKNLGIDGNYNATQLLSHKIKEFIILKKITFVRYEDIENGIIPGGKDIYTETLKILEETEGNKNGISCNDLRDFLHNVIHKIFFMNFEDIESINALINALRESLIYIVKNERALNYPLSRDVFIKLFEYLDEIQELSFVKEKMTREEVFNIVLKTLKNERIPFEGIPLKGLQILGMLETRNLQFKNVLILNTNEGILPATEKFDPILSIPVRKELKLKTYIDTEEIYRYHFKRLINGAENAYIFYIENDEFTRSRFVEELIWEHQQNTGKLEEPFTESVGFDTVIVKLPSPTIYKDSVTMDKIYQKMTDRGLSPTALDRYINCPLSFYYHYVLGLEEKDKVTQEIDAKTIGSLIHKILEKFFEPFKGQQIKINEKFHKNELNKHIDEVFVEFFPYGNKGELYLLRKVIQFRLEKFFDKLLSTYPDYIEIIETEKELSTPFQINNNCSIKLTGHIDRIEKLNDKYVIIDYKTGEVDGIKFDSSRLLQFSAPLSRNDAKKFIKSFQLPVYLILLKEYKGIKEWDRMNSVIYSIKENKEYQMFKQNEEIGQVMETIIIPTLKNLIQEIMSPDVPFYKDDSWEKGCIYCSYPVLCRKM